LREQKLRETLAKQAQKNGHTDYAEAIATGAVDLDEASKVIREQETENLLISRGQQGRRVLAKRAGIGQDEFLALNLDTMTDDQFKSFIQGHEADVKGYQDADGNAMMAKTNKMGKVWDKDTQTWRNPSEMGLRPAPQVSKVHNVSGDLAKNLGDAAVENFTELHAKANDAVEMLNNTQRALSLVDNMVAGPGADVEMFVRRLAMVYGGDPDEAVANTEVFLAESGKRVAEIIKAFGSGTGLSDADREYAQKIAAGDIMVTPEAIKRLLKIQAKGAQGTIKHFEESKQTLKTRLSGEDKNLTDMFILKEVEPVPEGPPPRVWGPGGFK
jgi:hypothetical protein